MNNEIQPDKPTPRQIESKPFNLESLDEQFDAALHAALAQVKKGLAKTEYKFRDGIRDTEHLEHIRVTDLDGTILYDQDFELENALLKRVDTQDN